MHPTMLLGEAGAPCDGMPTISSVGSSFVTATGGCTNEPLTIRTALNLSGTIPTGGSVEYRFSWTTSGTPSYGSWTEWSAFSGSSGNLDINVELGTGTTVNNSNPSSTYNYDIQFRLIGTDGTTVCDGPDTGAGWSGTVYSCFA